MEGHREIHQRIPGKSGLNDSKNLHRLNLELAARWLVDTASAAMQSGDAENVRSARTTEELQITTKIHQQ